MPLEDSYDLSMFSRESRTFHVTIAEGLVWDMADDWPPSFEARALACWNKILAADPDGDAQALLILSRAFRKQPEEVESTLTGRQIWKLIAFLATDRDPEPRTTSSEPSATSSSPTEGSTASATSNAPAA